MSGGQTKKTTTVSTDGDVDLAGLWQVILFNDDVNEASFVVQCLRRVFGHGEQLAHKIMQEADRRGRSIAEVEEREKAQLHKDQLQSYGLTAMMEPI